MELFYYPLSRYSQKVLIAFYEKQLNFYPREIDMQDPVARKQLQHNCQVDRLPVLKQAGFPLVRESSIIIEHVNLHFQSGSDLIAGTPEEQLQVRLFDRLVDYDLSQQLFEIEKMRQRPAHDINHIKLKQLQKTTLAFLQYLDQRLADNHWLCGDQFSMADCALIPCLPFAREELTLFELDNLYRYWEQAELRGAWTLVKEDVMQSEARLISGIRNIP